ncbi:MAG: SDR family oxidoreductase [Deltaproteobacteria bacterium]|nr:SDR family oxidoreductase [Deltaproteobacteria bacterium]
MTDLSGNVFIVTGANTGIGKVAATDFARRGAHVFLACRSADKTQPVIDEIKRATGNDKVEFLALDLGDLSSVRTAAATFLARNLPLHVLVTNAGLAGQRGHTRSGFELAFGTNHVGHFLFTELLLDKLKASAPARIVNVASTAHYNAKGIDWDAVRKPTKTLTALDEYAVSKLANVLFTKELARRLAGTKVTTYALHPGVVATDVWRRVPVGLRGLAKLFMKSAEDGAKTTIYCATSPAVANETGKYYDDVKEKRPSKQADDLALAAELWKRSEDWTRA